MPAYVSVGCITLHTNVGIVLGIFQHALIQHTTHNATNIILPKKIEIHLGTIRNILYRAQTDCTDNSTHIALSIPMNRISNYNTTLPGVAVIDRAVGIAHHKPYIYGIAHGVLEVYIYTGIGDRHVANDPQGIQETKQAEIIRVFPSEVQSINNVVFSIKGTLVRTPLVNTDNRPYGARVRGRV